MLLSPHLSAIWFRCAVRDLPVNQFDFNFLHYLGLIDVFTANEHAEILACVLLKKHDAPISN